MKAQAKLQAEVEAQGWVRHSAQCRLTPRSCNPGGG